MEQLCHAIGQVSENEDHVDLDDWVDCEESEFLEYVSREHSENKSDKDGEETQLEETIEDLDGGSRCELAVRPRILIDRVEEDDAYSVISNTFTEYERE
jgi:hypothetical protein